MIHRRNIRDLLKELITSYQKGGKYTHCYVACGFFHEEDPRFEFDILPENKTFFDLASLTKPLALTPLVFGDLKKKNLKTTTPLARWLTERDALCSALGKMRVEDLLAHESRLPSWRNLWVTCPQDSQYQELKNKDKASKRLGSLVEGSLLQKKFVYSDLGYILLGLCLEAVAKHSLSFLFDVFCKKNLGLKHNDILYGTLLKDKQLAIPTSYYKLRKRLLQGEVQDENAWFLGGEAGHAGLFATGPGLLSFLNAFMISGIGQQVLEENKKKRVKRGCDEQGLCGWRQGLGESSEVFGRGQAIGHLGFTGTAFWCLPEKNQYAILLTNRTVSGRRSFWMTDFRRHVFSLMNRLLNS